MSYCLLFQAWLVVSMCTIVYTVCKPFMILMNIKPFIKIDLSKVWDNLPDGNSAKSEKPIVLFDNSNRLNVSQTVSPPKVKRFGEVDANGFQTVLN